MGDLTEHFSRAEFACRGKDCCGGSAPINLNLVAALQELRSKLNAKLVVTSGFRCRTHNSTIPNAASTSRHLFGLAADIACPEGMTMDDFLAAARQMPEFKGIGKGNGFLHLDIDGDQRREWNY